MDIAKLSMSLSKVNVMQEVNISMIKKAITQMEQASSQIVNSIGAAQVSVPVEGTVDIKI